jgi:N-acetylmuramoyl-L-alanine amidase
MMKRIIFALIFTLFCPFPNSEGVSYLKLRSNEHPGFLRLVVEAEKNIVSKITINQKGDNIIVRLPHADLLVHKQKLDVPYRIDKHMIVFTPGEFSGFKVFTLKNPDRLVIDIYQKKERAKRERSTIDIIRDRWRKRSEPPFMPERQPGLVRRHEVKEVKTVVIDPGHGGYETGTVEGNDKEKHLVLEIAKELSSLVNKGTKLGLLTRESDQFLSLRERVEFANSRDTDVFLSLHIGKHSNVVLYTPVITEEFPQDIKNVLANKGQEDLLPETEALRRALESMFKKNFGDDMVSSRPLPYSVLSDIRAAALIIELPSFSDADYIAELKTELAQTMYQGISLYEEKTAN